MKKDTRFTHMVTALGGSVAKLKECLPGLQEALDSVPNTDYVSRGSTEVQRRASAA